VHDDVHRIAIHGIVRAQRLRVVVVVVVVVSRLERDAKLCASLRIDHRARTAYRHSVDSRRRLRTNARVVAHRAASAQSASASAARRERGMSSCGARPALIDGSTFDDVRCATATTRRARRRRRRDDAVERCRDARARARAATREERANDLGCGIVNVKQLCGRREARSGRARRVARDGERVRRDD
jgi:hypothetical protein